MAIDNRLQVFNEEGQSVDYDILASDVKFLPDGKDLPTKLAEMQDEIDQAGQGDGTVTGVKVGSDTYEPTEGVVDLSTPFSGKVDKVNGKGLSTNDYTDVDKTKLQNLPTADELTQQLSSKANDADVVKSISVNGTQQSKDSSGNVAISGLATTEALAQGLGGKQNTLTWDDVPTSGSDNAVKSKGIKAALIAKANAVDVPTKNEMADAIEDAVGNAQVAVVPVGSVGVIAGLGSDSDSDALAASMGRRLNLRLAEIEGGKIDTEEDGFFVIDENGNIGMQYDEDGFDVALLSQHFIALLNQAGIGSSYKSQCVVRFLPFLSAWDNASKNSLCLCSTKQQLVDNKVPFYDGFLFHKLPTDDKSLWYGTTLDNAVQIGTMSVYPKNYQLAMSPKDGRVIAAIRGNGQQRADLHVWDGTTDTAVAAVSSDGNSRKPLGWLYNCGYDFIKNGNNEYMIFAEYNGDGTNKGGYYVWKGTYPYTSPNDWKTVFHRPYAGKAYGTIAYGTIAHFHMVRRDPWTNILYLAAGDYPTQLIWWYSTDYGETWTELTNNETNGWEQHVARACNMVFTKDYIYWANDHGVNHCLNRVARNAQTGIIDPSTREKLCDLRFGQACNSICYVESPHGLFMYERIDTGDEFSQQYGTPVKMYFWDIDQGKLYEVANVPLLSGQTWGGSRGKCYLHYTSGQQPRPAMGFSDDTRCIFDIAGSDGQNIGTIFYEL